ncbi:MAG: orotate phosphoribosyltransferase [Omnitrophica bacterium RBG_13_46_9]|nr:MAG: orotate phosphoribosyltransferase [Omnitrophica bacterium RBG_13_46_9]
MKESEILDIFKRTGAFLEGHFKLSSGLHSALYLQCAVVLQHPEHAERLCKALAVKFKDMRPTAVIAPALGGILVSHEVAGAVHARGLFCERIEGKMALRRGFELGKKDKVIVVEDVVTTGLSTREVIDVVRSYGAHLLGVGCLVDRSKGVLDFGARFERLLTIDIPTFEPENCPLCKENVPIIKPGSRK